MKNPSKPNILVFMTDQQRGDSIFPASRAITPNIDRFCQEGVTFTNAYTVAPHCCPSRASFFSGLYPSQHGVWNNVRFNNALSRGFYDGVKLFSEDLKDDGYRMFFAGKWHSSAMETPLDRGFEVLDEPVKKAGKLPAYMMKGLKKQEYRHVRPGTDNWNLYDNFVQRRPEERVESEIIRNGYPPFKLYGEDDDIFQDQDVVDAAINNLKAMQGSDRPWFQYIGTLGPHDPYIAPRRFLDLYRPEDIELPKSFYDAMEDKPAMGRRVRDLFGQLSEREHREAIRHYLAFCSFQDELFGQVLAALEESGQADNTLVVFTSDHGDYAAEHGLWCKGLPCFRGAYHIPLAMRWPAGIKAPGRLVDSFVNLTDFAPTFVELAGCAPDREFAGKSLLPFLENRKPGHWADELYTQTNGNELYAIQRSVMTREWKYVFNGYDYDELYNLAEDPDEMINLLHGNAGKFADVVKMMSKKMWAFAKEHDDVCVHPYIFVGLASYGPGVLSGESVSLQ